MVYPAQMQNLPKYQRSYGRIQSRALRDGAKNLLSEVLPEVEIKCHPGECWDLKIPAFAGMTQKEVWLEIGFGDGGHLAHQAKSNSHTAIIGCEPYINGTVKLLREIKENNLNNIRIFHGDFRELISSSSRAPRASRGSGEENAGQDPQASLREPEDDVGVWNEDFSRIFILFPDPWPKKKQNKRRLISQQTLEMLYKIAKPGAALRIVTDHPDYAKWIIRHVLDFGKFRWTATSRAGWETPPQDHIETKYQKKDMAKQNKLFFFELQKPL